MAADDHDEVIHRRHWRYYKTEAGNSPVRVFIRALGLEDRAEVHAAMKEVRDEGLVAAKHIRRDIYEVVADADEKTFRILFAKEGRFGHVLLALVPFVKKTRTTPPGEIDLAEKRLAGWRARGRLAKRGPKKGALIA